ncbi:NAD-dependent succinate-semialdehyde dehydrogenase [Azospirillum sp. INR13]|uniref:NAD-dependent succinate-semialdehyde dehydrogenase n=1 Tax=Azospirillum sp. INR13 TaxID=2596919 RepID=UPI001891F4AF|nr:NAD-dependent succinate-semialdehyde dehydrogenase [Azospirillum sp. INR13]MBF5095619.1 NAD-dependent succinate-semialdehyde dehydrogenase [Azospirillum sp. INR13]
MTNTTYPDLRLWIGGRWIETGDRTCEPVINPATGATLGLLPHATIGDVDAAVAAAGEGFRGWRRTSAVERSALLRRTADLMRAEAGGLATLIALELGKPVGEAAREVETAAAMFDWAAEECRRSYGRIIPPRTPGHRLMVMREPVGPVAAFSGWNAPAITPARKIAGALGAGCSIVIKPSEGTPAAALFIARALAEAGLPAGVANMLFGNPGAVADRLLEAEAVRMVSFTGSIPVGKHLAVLATRTMKRGVFELGGHAPVLVFPDVDVEGVARSAAAAKFRSSGQVCTSPTRFYVHESIHDRFAAAFAEAASAIRVGDPFDPATQMGPVQNSRRLAAIDALVEDARRHGATVAAGGARIDRPGFFYQPTVLTGVTDACRAAAEEPFGPLALIASFRDPDEAVTLANRLSLGLASYVFTRDLALADRLAAEIECGNVVVNHWVVSHPETPFGGIKDSGIGLEGGTEGFQAFEQVKFVSLAPH